jgi:hypothetical protein
MDFSFRIPSDLTSNPISKLIDSIPQENLIDLTESNPTKCGFHYPENLFESLSTNKNSAYAPQPAGMLEARQVIADYLFKRGLKVKSSQLLLTSSTSEAYAYLFKLLGNPGDKFLVPTPGYPLIDHLARLESVLPLPYPFKVTLGWPLDQVEFHKLLEEKPKAVIAVNPQNPTGVALSESDLNLVLQACAKNRMAFISDEVFWDYLQPPRSYRPFSHHEVLSFRLGGLSKCLGLPQLKLAWILVEGPELMISEALERLEFIADSYLSVQTPVQNALPNLFQTADDFQNQVRTRISQNRKILEDLLNPFKEKVQLWPFEGGWYNLIEMMNKSQTDEEWVMELIEKAQILIHPGSFYDIGECCLGVISLLPKTGNFKMGILRLINHLSRVL